MDLMVLRQLGSAFRDLCVMDFVPGGLGWACLYFFCCFHLFKKLNKYLTKTDVLGK